MPEHVNDPAIPTLTLLANLPEPAPGEPSAALLTELANPMPKPTQPIPWQVGETLSHADAVIVTVLRAALQAELERMMQDALTAAQQTVRAQLETELPTIIAKVLTTVRPG